MSDVMSPEGREVEDERRHALGALGAIVSACAWPLGTEVGVERLAEASREQLELS